MSMTLESLLADLEKQAGVNEEGTDEKEKNTNSKDEKSEDGKEVKKTEDKSEKTEKEVKEEQEKKASEDLANQIMQKVASVQSTEEKNEMQKQASIAGKALADALMTKLANAGDVSTETGIPAGVVPNKNQVDNAQLVAEQAATIKPMPTGDGVKNEGSINQIFDAIVQDAIAQGGVTPVAVNAGQISGSEGAVEGHAVPNQVMTEGVEKVAAVSELVAQGFDFDSAVDMVKSAAAEIEYEEDQQIKQAAFNELLDQGLDFDLAAEMVKSANALVAVGKRMSNEGVLGALARKGRDAAGYVSRRAGDVAGAVKNYGSALAADARLVPAGVGALAQPGKYATGLTRGAVAKDLVRNKAVQLGAGVGALGALGGGAYALGREKQAAVQALCDAGVDFDSAAELVQAKSYELYGA